MEKGSGEIKRVAQITVWESQAGVFFYNGRAYEAFGPGRHTLKTANIPILTKVLSLPGGMTSPLRAERCFINMKVFPNLKWGTRCPVAFRDLKLGLIRLVCHPFIASHNELIHMIMLLSFNKKSIAYGILSLENQRAFNFKHYRAV